VASTKTVFESDIEYESKKIRTIVALKEVHCSNRYSRVLKEVGYLESGETAYLFAFDPAAKEFSPVIPESVGELLLSVVCQWEPPKAKLMECSGPTGGVPRVRRGNKTASGHPGVPAAPVPPATSTQTLRTN
jgi:hypothetical protein